MYIACIPCACFSEITAVLVFVNWCDAVGARCAPHRLSLSALRASATKVPNALGVGAAFRSSYISVCSFILCLRDFVSTLQLCDLNRSFRRLCFLFPVGDYPEYAKLILTLIIRGVSS